MSAVELNGRVRNVNVCFLPAIVTEDEYKQTINVKVHIHLQ
jgi:hypothetical protein